jgi:hypothetical protein
MIKINPAAEKADFNKKKIKKWLPKQKIFLN